MEKPLLNDPDISPSEDVLKEALGTSYAAFEELIAGVTSDPMLLVPEWRYYKDGKAWLCKVVHKKKTVFWLSVWDKYFKVAFYFTEKAKSGIAELSIRQELKDNFNNAKPIGKLLPMVIEVLEMELVPDVLVVAEFKMTFK